MIIKDLFRIVIKLFGLYHLTGVIFSSIPNFVIMTVREPELGSLLSVLLSFFLVSLIFIGLIYPDFIIRILKLDKGYSQTQISFRSN